MSSSSSSVSFSSFSSLVISVLSCYPSFTYFLTILLFFPWLITLFLLQLKFYELVNVCAIGDWRSVISPLFDDSLLSGLLGLFAFSQVGRKLELRFGSVWLFTATASTAILINLAYPLFIGAFSSPSVSADQFFCVSGLWPAIASLLVVENFSFPLETRRFPLLPFKQIPAKLIPLLIILFYSLLVQLRPATLFGFAFGHASYYPLRSQLMHSLCGAFEQSFLVRFLRSRPNFVSLSDAGSQPGLFRLFKFNQIGDANNSAKEIIQKQSQEQAEREAAREAETEPEHNGEQSNASASLMGEFKDSGSADSNSSFSSSSSLFSRRLVELQSMGFSRSDSLRALRHSDGSIERAVEFITNSNQIN